MKPSEDMGFSLDPRKISSKRQSSSKTANLKPKSGSIGQTWIDPCHTARQEDADGKIRNRQRLKGSSTRRDELVKHMSNLPGFLQHTNRGENIQEKALNVGVLDWSQLEKWKNKQAYRPGLASNFTSFNSSEESSSSSSLRPKKLDEEKGLNSSIKASYREGYPESSKLSSQDVKLYEYFEIERKIIGDERRMSPWEFESLGKTHTDASLQRENRNDHDKIITLGEYFAAKSAHHGVYENTNDKDIEAKTSKEGLQQHSHNKKERNHNSSSDKVVPSLKSKDKGVLYGSQKKVSSRCNEEKRKMNQWQESDIDVGQKQWHSKPSTIVLLRPRQVLESSSSDYFQLSQLRTSSDENSSESSQSSLSYVPLPEEVYNEDECFEIPHSSVLPSVTELASSSETNQQSVNTDVVIDHSSVVSKETACSDKMSNMQSEHTCIEKDVLDIKLRYQCAFSSMKESQDQETAEQTVQLERNSSSHRRLSFSLNRIGRSLSFKEGSTIPQLSSTYVSAKSGPLSSESSACLKMSSKEKVIRHNRTMSSPLMRLLDPILNNKASNMYHSAESNPKPKGNTSSINFTTINQHSKRSNGSPIQALLQLTIKNGLPLFKFAVNSERKVLAATMKSLASPEKDDVGCYFTFYLVNEIKKKSGGWMSHRSKEKSCGYVYNIVGQMKLSSSKSTEPSNQHSKKQFLVREYVLLDVEIDPADQGPPKFIKTKELAAVVIEIPCENSSHEGLDSNDLLKNGCFKCLAEERCFCSTGENDISFSTKVILPGGAHSSPNIGGPSPLIQRWKSGGSCDCGGWDVGCKLLVLSNQKSSSTIPRISKSHLERFQLFVEEGAEQDTAFFTLVPLKDGFYSVEFSSTITHLQAFFVSVAVFSSQKLPSSLEMGKMHEEINKEPSSKNKNELQEKETRNYNPIPPLSPVGRV